MKFFVGLHQLHHAYHFRRCFISVGRLRDRKSPFIVNDWIMDSQAFSTILTHGGYPYPPEEYAEHIRRWKGNGNLLAAVTQDYMCEKVMLAKTGLSTLDHQRLTIQRYDDLLRCGTGCYIMPVLQGYYPSEYAEHIKQYGKRLKHGMWVGVGSVCKRNGSPELVDWVLDKIKSVRPDLNLHGFGLKITALTNRSIRRKLKTSDSMSWSYHARMHGLDANGWEPAMEFVNRIERL